LSTLLILMGASERSATRTADGETATWTVVSGAFDVYLSEHGVFEALESAALSSQLPSNKAKVIALVPEGTLVMPGDVVAEFDQSGFREELERIENDLADARSQLDKAETETALKRQELATRSKELQVQVQLAGLDHRRLVQVEIPFKRQAAVMEVSESHHRHQQTKKELTTTSKLAERGYASGDELQAAVEVNERAADTIALAKARLRLLDEIEFPAETSQSSMKYEQLQALSLAFENDIPSELRLKQALLNRAGLRVDKLVTKRAQTQGYLDASVVVTPVEGFVSHPELMFGKDTRKVQVGDSVWRQQPFVVIPDLASLIARIDVREVDVGAVRAGQSVEMRPHAFSDRALRGGVVAVGAMRTDRSNPNVRRFEVRVAIHDKDARLRPGMTGKARLHTHHYADTPLVPVEAVHYLGGHPVVFRAAGSQWASVPVTLGGNDGSRVAILQGLAGGETVALNKPPLVAAGS
jgi:multidrug resistance efflux pump